VALTTGVGVMLAVGVGVVPEGVGEALGPGVGVPAPGEGT
jgi:hypothetical protein